MQKASGEKTTRESAIASVSGNICRCTGYKSIERAADTITTALADRNLADPVRWLVEHHQLPGYFLTIPERLAAIPEMAPSPGGVFRLAGGTDMMVQKADELAESDIVTFGSRKELKGIDVRDGRCIIGGSVTFSEAGESAVLKQYLRDFSSYIRPIASEPIRNMATIAGNIVNASPIGDMSIIMLALNADVTVEGQEKTRIIPLRKLYLGYKKTDLSKEAG